jgi:hypothetical protein
MITVPSCPPRKHASKGIGEFVCKHGKEFESYAREIDPRIQTEVLPPDPHPKDMFCRRFTLKE